jgi:Fe-S-cluster containining protein
MNPIDPDLSLLPAAIRARWPLAVERARAKTAQVPADSESVRHLIQASQRARTVAQRVLWMQRAASAWSRPMEAFAACRRGCSHCCHIPVMISRTEAELIGTTVRRSPARPAHAIDLAKLQTAEDVQEAQATLQAATPTGEPCPFLADGACSIYAHRPLACRVLLNLDDDDLLCRLVPGVSVPVPYADATTFKALSLMAQPNAELADIREFFPPVCAGATGERA